MIRIAQTTPLLPGETVMSWVARIARDETGMGPFAFLNLIEVNRKHVLEATPDGLDRLAEITGVPRPRLEEGAYLRHGERFYTHRGHAFHAEFAGRARTTFCPACLLADARSDSPSGGSRVGRVNWFFDPVRTCPAHRMPLVRTMSARYADRYQDMALVAPCDERLHELAAGSATRPVSSLQTYVEARLAGNPGPAWLDGQQIDQASRASEILGAVLIHGSHVDLPDLSEDDWDAAGAAGFAFTSRGEEGIRDALDRIFRRFRETETKGGPQAVYGRLYQWIEFHRSGKSRGPIRDVLRERVLEMMAVEPGTHLLGEIVRTRRRHSVASLSRETGVHPRTLNRALVLGGLLPNGDPDRVDGLLSFDAKAGERFADRLRDAIPVAKVPAYLNCNRTQAQALAWSGLIGRIGGEAEARSKIALSMIARSELDDFLARFRTGGTPMAFPSDGMIDVIAAAKVSRWPVIDIVRLVLDGGLSRTGLLSVDLGFRSVLVDPQEVRSVLDARQARGRLSIAEASDRIGVSTTGIRALMSEPDRDGNPFLASAVERNGQGAERVYFEAAELDRYAARHVDLKEIAAERGVAAKILRGRLSAAGIEPILPRLKMNRLVYRRADL